MHSYAPLLILAAGLALWGFGLWRQGFFGQSTLPVERRVYYVRVILFFVAIVVVAWPLELYRKAIGEVAYVAAAALILALFFGLGLLAAKLMFKLHTTGKPS
jgi:hypothetical protein